MGKLYGAAPQDDIKLANEVRPFVDALHGRIPDMAELQTLTGEQGNDHAAAVFYQAIRAVPRHRRFIDQVDQQQILNPVPETGIKMFVIPAFFYREYPEVGGDGQHIIDVARACGIDAQLIPVHSTGSISSNIPIIQETLQRAAGNKIWLLSMSKGGAEIRRMLQESADTLPLEDIQLWFNVSGLINGCDLVDHMLGSPVRRLKTRALCVATGAEYTAMEELLTDRSCWKTSIPLPSQLKVINIFGIPLVSHLQKALLARYHRLKHLGPNDGMVLLSRAYIDAGPIYPLWGADHFMRDARVIPLLYRLFGLLLSTDHGEIFGESAEEIDRVG